MRAKGVRCGGGGAKTLPKCEILNPWGVEGGGGMLHQKILDSEIASGAFSGLKLILLVSRFLKHL